MVDLHVGDLVYLDNEAVTGVIVGISVYAIGYEYGSTSLRIADVEVMWNSGEQYWCLAESLTVISKIIQYKKNS